MTCLSASPDVITTLAGDIALKVVLDWLPEAKR